MSRPAPNARHSGTNPLPVLQPLKLLEELVRALLDLGVFSGGSARGTFVKPCRLHLDGLQLLGVRRAQASELPHRLRLVDLEFGELC